MPKHAQDLVATLVRSIFAQPDATAVQQQYSQVTAQLRASGFSRAAQSLEDCREDKLAFTAHPKAHWRQTWNNNPQERLNREIRRRTDLVEIFPNRKAVIRLLGAVLAEQHDEWVVSRRYMTMEKVESTPDALDAAPLTSNTQNRVMT